MMIKTDRPAAYFVADAPSIDFLNTYSTTNGAATEWLADGDDLLDWLKKSDLVPSDVLESFRTKCLPGEMDAVAAQARVLREWFRSFVTKRRGKVLSPKFFPDIEPLNRILERDQEFGQVTIQSNRVTPKPHSGFSWSIRRRWQSADSLLFPVARSMATLVCDDAFTDIRMCEGVGCNLLFIDRTRMRNRRWCTMALCGNRAKQVSHRLRHRSA